MRSIRPVRWREGMFLRPHHFQQLELFVEAREIARVRALSAQAWGLLYLEINEASLDNFTLDLSALRAVLPDGTLIDFPGNASLPDRDLSAQMTEAGRSLEVRVGVRRREERAGQTEDGDGAGKRQTRYLVREGEVFDLETGEGAELVETLEFDLRFFLGDEPTDGYEALAITRLLRSGNPAKPVIVDPDFAPPVLMLGASPVLAGSARAVVERLAVTLRAMKAAQGGQDAVLLTLYQALSSAMPVLRDMVEDGAVHPRRVYRELSRLAGTLLFRDESGRNHEEIPLYSHEDPAPVFEVLRRLIEELSEPVITCRWLRIPLARTDDLYSASLPDRAKEKGARFYLEAEADASAPGVRGLMLGAKISEPSRIATLSGHALPGVLTEALPGPPPELPPGQTATYFRLKSEEEEWGAHVQPAGELAVFLLGAPDDISLNLIVVLPA